MGEGGGMGIKVENNKERNYFQYIYECIEWTNFADASIRIYIFTDQDVMLRIRIEGYS